MAYCGKLSSLNSCSSFMMMPFLQEPVISFLALIHSSTIVLQCLTHPLPMDMEIQSLLSILQLHFWGGDSNHQSSKSSVQFQSDSYPLHSSDFHSWYRYCRPYWRSCETLGLNLQHKALSWKCSSMWCFWKVCHITVTA